MLKLSIVIVSWRSKDYLKKCLYSIYYNLKNITFEIIVVDNGSKDGTADMIKINFPAVAFFYNNDNYGFSKANNQGIKHSRGKYVLILNPDTLIMNAAIQKLMMFLDKHVDIGAIGPKILNPDNSVQLTCARNFPTPLTEFFSTMIIFKKLSNYRIFGEYLLAYWDHNNSRQVNALSGACMMIRRRTFDKIGLFDERYFMYAEDLDICYRIKKKGWKIWYLPEAQIIHYGGQSSSQAVEETYFRYYESMEFFYRKYYGCFSVIFYKAVLFFYSCCTNVCFRIISMIGGKKRRGIWRNQIIRTFATIKWILDIRRN